MNKPRKKKSDWFHHFASKVSDVAGAPGTFVLAVVVIVTWAITGPLFKFSDTWQLVINTGTTIVTFLMVFLIQNTQNRDAKAMHLKLDELIFHMKGARNTLIDLEDMSEDELKALHEEFHQLRDVNEDLHERGHEEIEAELERRKKKHQKKQEKKHS